MSYLHEIAARNIEAHKKGQEFKKIFGVQFAGFWNSFFGFDVVKFDAWLEVPDGVSTSDFITQKYGAEACALVRSLL